MDHWLTEAESTHKKIQEVLDEAAKSVSPEAMQHLHQLLKRTEDDLRRDLIVRARKERPPSDQPRNDD